jgi:hypothetical protein
VPVGEARLRAQRRAERSALHLVGDEPRRSSGGIDPDAPDAEREPEAARTLTFESADSFLARLEAQGDPGWMVGDLVPEDGIAVWHGRPRSMKSLAALEMNLACATDAPAFGCDRFATTTRGGSVLYLTEEDGERLIASRLRLMLAGRGLDARSALERLKLLSRPGWNLEQTADQSHLMAAIREVSPPPVMLTLDPARGSMPALDKGPSDAAIAIRFLRRMLRETTIRAVLILHHDVKPARDAKEDRSRAERASGGAVFSIADCPVNFERVSDRSCFAVPSMFKVGADPRPFRIDFESGTPAGEPFRRFVRARAAASDEDGGLRDRVLAYVKANPWSATAEVDRGVSVRGGESARYLAQLQVGGMVESASGEKAKALGRSPNATLWKVV